MKYCIYILCSDYDKSLYVGQTDDIVARIKEHNTGRSRFTKGRSPWKLIYQEEFRSRSAAIKREHFLKSGVGRKELKNICPVV